MAFHPSDFLSQIAGAIFMLERSTALSGDMLENWLDRVTDELSADLKSTTPEWEMSSDELTSLMESLNPAVLQGAAATYSDFFIQVACLQKLDRWHFPLTLVGSSSGARKSQLHEVAADNLAFKGYFGKYNSGRIIPSTNEHETPKYIQKSNQKIFQEHYEEDPLNRGIGLSIRPNLLRPILENTIFLPWQLDAPHADDPTIVSPRQIKVEYVQPFSRLTTPIRDLEIPPRIAIAPLAQAKADIEFEITEDGNKYSVKPIYSSTRINNVISRSVKEGVEYLYFPELTVRESDIATIKISIRDSVKKFTVENNSIPPFRGIFAGISGDQGEQSENYVVAIDMYGVETWRQSKLFRWNLNSSQCDRFDLTSEFSRVGDPLFENIAEGESITIYDSPDLGRSLLFICADISSNSPGDWLLTSAGVNWVYAPIMDQSIGWRFDTRGVHGPWITRRAHRAAFAASAQILVTNSMTLTHRVNTSNYRKGDARVFSECGIAFLVDSTAFDPMYCLIEVPTGDIEDVLAVVNWGVGWNSI